MKHLISVSIKPAAAQPVFVLLLVLKYLAAQLGVKPL
jgi:hypothetical protein